MKRRNLLLSRDWVPLDPEGENTKPTTKKRIPVTIDIDLDELITANEALKMIRESERKLNALEIFGERVLRQAMKIAIFY